MRKDGRQWSPPNADAEFIFDGIDKLPAWADKNWASFDRGPAIALPAGDLWGEGPYTTKTARIGDKVLFVAAVGSTPAHFEVVRREPEPEKGTKRIAQQSAAQEEDLLKLGWITPDDLGEDAKAQIIGRSPRLKRMIEENENLPERQNPSDLFATD